MSMLMVELEELTMRCEELKILNKIKLLKKIKILNQASPQQYWSTKTQQNLQSFGNMVKNHLIFIQDRLRPALDRLYASNEEGDLVEILRDSWEQKEGKCYLLRTKGARWLSDVREHIEHLQAVSQYIKRVDENLVELVWTSPLSEGDLATERLKCNGPTVVRTKQEAFSRDYRREVNHFDLSER